MKKNSVSILLFMSIIVSMILPYVNVMAYEAYPITFTVNYKQTEARKMAEMLNQFRDEEGFDNESAEPLEYDYNLEKVAMQRAAEIAIRFADVRPDGESYKETLADYGFDISPRNILYGENIVFGTEDSMELEDAFAELCSNDVNRRNMLGYFTSVGIGHIKMNGTTDFWVQVFADETKYSFYTDPVDGKQEVTIKVSPSVIDSVNVSYTSGNSTVAVGETANAPVYTPKVSFIGSELDEELTLSPLVFESEDGYVKASGGKITGLKNGTGTIKANLLGQTYSYNITVTGNNGTVKKDDNNNENNSASKLNKGDTFEADGIKYRVASKNTVELVSCSSSQASVLIPDTVSNSGTKYKVVKILDSAFSENKKLKSVSLGKNIKSIGKNAFKNCTSLESVEIAKSVTSIGKQAFYGCKKLANIKFLGIKVKKIGSKAFKNINSKAIISVPSGSDTKYKKLLKSGGLSSKITVTIY